MRLPFLNRFFAPKPKEDSRNAARERLKNALVGDRCSVAPSFADSLKSELGDLLAKYMDVDASSLQVELHEGTTWKAQVRVVRVHRQAHLPEAALADPRQSKSRPRRLLRATRWRRSQEDLPAVEEKSA
jgi:cell division topological specificity factor MinE